MTVWCVYGENGDFDIENIESEEFAASCAQNWPDNGEIFFFAELTVEEV